MRKALIALAAALAAVVSVHAEEFQAVVEAVDFDAQAVTFDDGETLIVSEGVDYSSIAEGDTVNVITDDSTGEITEIMIAE
ncbi:hypothetical protein [Oricola sp.]|uniref:hypothetical protein n=1 Tax=Oricola sp. TaxID=1979950 RepID=UPI0025D9CDBA|nr:hypothetical protein [Oricola sp.]MCI5074308.1 hypothetical protein [Oricola sp.]